LKQLLHDALKAQREALVWKVEGLSEDDARRLMTPSLTNLLGLVKHLAGIERGYFCDAFGRPREPIPWEDEELWHGGDMWPRADETTEYIIGEYRASWAMADPVIDELDIDAPGRHWTGRATTLGGMLVTVLVDTARHAGHADIVRELIDGSIGGSKAWAGTPDPNDTEYWSMQRKRITGEITRDEWMTFARSHQPPS
jgi:hypothetical protein